MISVFFYCFAINDWKIRLSRQINRIVSSGLYDGADELFLFVTDTSGQLQQEVKSLIANLPKIFLNYTTTNYGEGFLALSKLDELSREPKDRKILYFHTKGVFNKYKNFATKEIDEIKIKGVDCWVEIMEYHLIDKWKDCVDLLDENDIVGTSCHGYWWWGNFWWTKSSHVRKIPPIKNFYNGSRWSVEAWIHESAPDKHEIPHRQLRPIKYDPCYSILPNYFHDKSIDTSSITINIKEAKYGYFAQQRDEGRKVPETSEKLVDVTDKVRDIIEANPMNEIRIDQVIPNFDVAHGQEKSLRIKFRTNIDPEQEYTITSFGHWNLCIIS